MPNCNEVRFRLSKALTVPDDPSHAVICLAYSGSVLEPLTSNVPATDGTPVSG